MKKQNMSLFTIIVKLMLDIGICRSWYEIALLGCLFVDYGMKLHLPTSPNYVKELFPEVWQSFLQLLPLRQRIREGWDFSELLSSKEALKLARCIQRA